MLRSVSGRKTVIARTVILESTSRKMKMDRKPRKFARTPPRTGPAAMLKFRIA
jgi:alkyl sulfatase BDS1-like metallo-beta-lactamase superfamily hydrolase